MIDRRFRIVFMRTSQAAQLESGADVCDNIFMAGDGARVLRAPSRGVFEAEDSGLRLAPPLDRLG
ncbi:MAG: hypothetical protein JKY37_07170 [Nannocystaceae bacterium]|nr:hypothetical protein [Nannocystaceae bacterium]